MEAGFQISLPAYAGGSADGARSDSTASTGGSLAVRTLVVDRRPVRRHGLARLVRLVGAGPALSLSDLEQYLEVRDLAELAPELILVGVDRGEFPHALVGRVRELGTHVLAVLDDPAPGEGQRALEAGVSGYLLSEQLGVEALSQAIGIIATGRRAVPALSDLEIVGASGRGGGAQGGVTVTRRCREVLTLLADGLHDDEVANALGISTSSVRKHLAVAQERLGARTRTQAVALATREGLL